MGWGGVGWGLEQERTGPALDAVELRASTPQLCVCVHARVCTCSAVRCRATPCQAVRAGRETDVRVWVWRTVVPP